MHRIHIYNFLQCDNLAGIHVKTNRKTKDSSKSSLFRTKKSNYKCLTKDLSKDGKCRMLEGLEFLLTGFSRKKKGEVETLIRRHGGLVLPEIPLPYLSLDHTDRHLPIVLSPKKVHSLVKACLEDLLFPFKII